jgi:hypothetical protein
MHVCGHLWQWPFWYVKGIKLDKPRVVQKTYKWVSRGYSHDLVLDQGRRSNKPSFVKITHLLINCSVGLKQDGGFVLHTDINYVLAQARSYVNMFVFCPAVLRVFSLWKIIYLVWIPGVIFKISILKLLGRRPGSHRKNNKNKQHPCNY